MAPRIIRRKDWGAKPAKSGMAAMVGPVYAVIHHTTGATLGHDDIDQFVRNIQSFHQRGNGWNDIGYHFLIDPNTGDIYEGRGLRYGGAHVGKVTTRCPARNNNSIGIAILGDSDKGALTGAAKASIRWLLTKYQPKQTFPHSAAHATSCPGKKAREWMAQGMPAPGKTGPSKPTDPKPKSKPKPVKPPVKTAPHTHPAWPGRYIQLRRPLLSGKDVETWQRQMRRRGWNIEADGVFGQKSHGVLVAFQKEKGLKPDGVLGPVSWRAAWTAKVTK